MSGPSPFCPSSRELRLEQLAVADELITITAAGRRETVPCSACGASAIRVHSRYVRTLADLPWQGTRVRLVVTVRRFFCEAAGCERRIFAECLPETAARYARRTGRVATLLELIGFALGGRAGSRMAAALGLASAPGTVLARVRAAAAAADGSIEVPTPRVLGVDDWALRRGQRYGTLLVDLERHRVIDLLPDREAATLAAWLRAHPGVEIISRDRGGAYAEGARQGAPDAVQVADRFHLLHNLVEALERVCARHHTVVREAAEEIGPAPRSREELRQRRYSGLPANSPGPTAHERQSAERRARRLERYERVVALRARGMPKKRIARELGLDRRTVTAWLTAGHFPERAPRTTRQPRLVEAYMPQIAAYYDRGGTNAAALARQLAAEGYRGTDATVRRALTALRMSRQPAVTVSPSATTARAAVPVPSPRAVAWLLRKPAEKLSDGERTYVTALTTKCPAIAEAQALADRFARMLREHEINELAPWLSAAEGSELKAFARGIRRDYDAVLAALCFPWSNGQVEGQVHRLKLVKRTMYGRAKLDLLRARVLHAA